MGLGLYERVNGKRKEKKWERADFTFFEVKERKGKTEMGKLKKWEEEMKTVWVCMKGQMANGQVKILLS